ncbi:MAG: hypothetical protein QG568_305 [Patescibacteria group bacterium]|nr:hypothetical protein [Patescibacteria group bacterium]
MKSSTLTIKSIVATLSLVAFVIGFSATNDSVAQAETMTVQTIQTNQTTPEAQVIQWPTIEAKSAFIYDPVGNVVIFEKNADTQRSMASLLKLMTAATVERILTQSPKLAEKQISILNTNNEAPADFALPAKSTWRPDPLVQIMLIGSSNKAAESLASGIIPRSSFMSLMNFNAKQMGLTQTYFRNPTGLTELGNIKATSTAGRLDVAAGVSTAREVAKLMWTIIAEHPGLLDITNKDSLTIPKANTSETTVVLNTNKTLNDFPIRFSKTGFTENSGGNLAVVLQKSETSHPYIIVVMGSTQEKRFEDVAKLASTTLALTDVGFDK